MDDGTKKIKSAANLVEVNKRNESNFGPCIEKKCSYCCNPVKVFRFFPDDKIPTNERGEKLWKERKEIFIPKSYVDNVKLRTYDCIYFDKSIGKCTQYDNRPTICRRVSCINANSIETSDEQYQKILDSEFIVITPIRRYHG